MLKKLNLEIHRTFSHENCAIARIFVNKMRMREREKFGYVILYVCKLYQYIHQYGHGKMNKVEKYYTSYIVVVGTSLNFIYKFRAATKGYVPKVLNI